MIKCCVRDGCGGGEIALAAVLISMPLLHGQNWDLVGTIWGLRSQPGMSCSQIKSIVFLDSNENRMWSTNYTDTKQTHTHTQSIWMVRGIKKWWRIVKYSDDCSEHGGRWVDWRIQPRLNFYMQSIEIYQHCCSFCSDMVCILFWFLGHFGHINIPFTSSTGFVGSKGQHQQCFLAFPRSVKLRLGLLN